VFLRDWLVASSMFEKEDSFVCFVSQVERYLKVKGSSMQSFHSRLCSKALWKNWSEAMSDVVVEERPFTRLGFPTGSGRPFLDVPPLHVNDM
jgi:hypothetical protein